MDKSSICSRRGERTATDLLMWRIILTAVRSISFAGWTRLYSPPPPQEAVCMSDAENTHYSCSELPQIKPLSRSVAQLCIVLRLSVEAIDVWNGSMMGKYKKKNDRSAVSISLQGTQGCSRGLCLKTQQLFTPYSPMSCLFSWLIVFSLLQSFLNFRCMLLHTSNI